MIRAIGMAVAAMLLAGCTSLLPHGSSGVSGPFASYAQAESAANAITSFSTRVTQLPAMGFDTQAGRNVGPPRPAAEVRALKGCALSRRWMPPTTTGSRA